MHPQIMVSAEETATPIAALGILAELRRDVLRRVQSMLCKTQLFAAFAGNSMIPCFLRAAKLPVCSLLLGGHGTEHCLEPSVAVPARRGAVRRVPPALPAVLFEFRLKSSAVDTTAGAVVSGPDYSRHCVRVWR